MFPLVPFYKRSFPDAPPAHCQISLDRLRPHAHTLTVRETGKQVCGVFSIYHWTNSPPARKKESLQNSKPLGYISYHPQKIHETEERHSVQAWCVDTRGLTQRLIGPSFRIIRLFPIRLPLNQCKILWEKRYVKGKQTTIKI